MEETGGDVRLFCRWSRPQSDSPSPFPPELGPLVESLHHHIQVYLETGPMRPVIPNSHDLEILHKENYSFTVHHAPVS